MAAISEILAFVNPIFFYYSFIYAICKTFQIISNGQSFLQLLWNKAFDVFGGDQEIFSVWILNGLPFILYWILGIVFTLMEQSGKPNVLKKFRIQENTNGFKDNKELSNVIKVVLFNQLISFPLAYTLFHNGNILKLQVSRELPNFPKVIFDLIVCMFTQEILFYYSHRMLHFKAFYKSIHKKHHEYKSPSAITAIYCNPIEHVLSNLVPVIAAFPLVKCHVSTALLWLTIVIVTTLNDHSGHHLPFLHSSELHDFHHLKSNLNYSVYGFMDVIHNTYGSFKQSINYQRHRTLFTIKPVREVCESAAHSTSVRNIKEN